MAETAPCMQVRRSTHLSLDVDLERLMEPSVTIHPNRIPTNHILAAADSLFSAPEKVHSMGDIL